MSIGSVQHIMDNLATAGETEPAVIVTMTNSALGKAANNFSGLLRYGKAASFGHLGLFSGAQAANTIQEAALDVPYMLIGDGLYEGG